ncbi:Putative_flagellar associated protein [Hexamita inflata]|uniref:Flagellar associated protein n=1 Tax=Hexamita inflata TaxID=28002 RepID=A0AA86UXP8_9EUKA|nr:Putative flagellar associated protein [Hexamita inflata]
MPPPVLTREDDKPSIQKIVHSIWRPTDIELPIFANDENIKLHETLHELTAVINTMVQELVQSETYINSMEAHKQAVQNELVHAQERVDAKQHEVDAEVHITQLQERDIGWIRQKITQTQARTQELEYIRGKMDTQLQAQNTKYSEYKKEQQWLLDEQQEWKLAQEQKSEDQFALQKYKAIDDKTYLEIKQAIDRQTTVVTSINKELADEIQKTQTAQVQLDKTATQFQVLQSDREFSIQQLQQAIIILDQRENETITAQQQLEDLNNAVNDLKQSDKELQNEIDDQMKDLKSAEHDFMVAERDVQIAVEELEEAKECERNMNGEIIVEEGQLVSYRRGINQMNDQLHAMTDQKDARQLALDQVQKRIDLFNSAKMKMTDRLLSVEELIEQERQNVDMLKEELAQWKKIQESASEELQNSGKNLHMLKEQEANAKSSISSYQAGLKGLEARILNMESQLQQQRRHIYNADFQIQALTRRLSHVRGDISAEEQLVLNKNITTLKQQLDLEKKSAKLVKQQTGSVLAEIGRVKRQLLDAQNQKHRVENFLNELVLASQTQILVVQQTTEIKQAELLQLDQLRITRETVFEDFQKRISILFGLRNRTHQIDIQQQQKAKELDFTRQTLQNELRLLKDELHTQRLELKLRRIAAQKLTCRCSVVTSKVAAMASKAKGEISTDGADPRTAQADAIIGFGKRKNELFQKLGQLKQIYEKVENEVKGLEQALRALQESNNKVRKMGRPAGAENQEELNKLKVELNQAETQVLYYVSQTRQVLQKVDELEQQNQLLRAEQDRLAEELNGMEYGV